jgi:amino acid adenylation domain-containing protein
VVSAVAAQVNAALDATAVLAVDQHGTTEVLTYEGLWARSGKVAAVLRSRGIGRGDVVAVAGGRSVDLVVAMLGVARSGAAYLPVDGHAPIARTNAMFSDAAVRVLLAADDSRPAFPGVEILPVSTLPAGSATVEPGPGSEDALYVNFTSGSTGRPKGVVVPHRAVLRLVTDALFCTVAPGHRMANLANPAFDATTFEVWHALTAGATIVALPSVADLPLDEWLALVAAERITTMFLTTSLFHMVARERPDAFAALDTLVVGGEQLDIGAVRRVLAAGPPARLVNGYGPTETTTFASYFDCTAESLAEMDRVPIGFPLQQTTLTIHDVHGEPAAPGVAGELRVGGPGVALGYLNRPELTAQRFVRIPGADGETAYRTGDLVRQLPTGAYELIGRVDDQVKLRGFRIELGEIEHAVRATGLVDHAYVVKVGDGPNAYLAGFLLAKTGAGAVAGNVAVLIADSLPDYMIPSRWTELTEIPHGPTGKVDRAALVTMLTEQTRHKDAESVDVPNETDGVGGEVENAWQTVLGVTSSRSADNFIDVGGNSILAIQLASRLRENLSVELRPAEVLLADSLGELTDHIRQAMARK